MKKIVIVVMAALFALSSNAAAEELKLQANKEGKVILESNQSPDGNEYILNNAEPAEEYGVMTLSATTFSANDYRNGFFDKPHITYQVNVSEERYRKEFYSMINNNINDSAQPGGTSIRFSEVLEIEGYYYKSTADNRAIRFYLNGVQVHARTKGTGYYAQKMKIDKITLNCTGSCGGGYSSEMEIFPIYKIDYIAVSDLEVTATEYSATAKFKKPTSQFFNYNQVLLNGVVIQSNTANTTVNLSDLTPDTTYQLTVRSYYSDGKFIDAIKEFRTLKDEVPPDEVTNLKAEQDGQNIKLTFDMPPDTDFSHVQILKSNAVVETEYKNTIYTDTEPKKNAKNTYTVKTIDKSGNTSKGVTVSITHDDGEIKSLKAVASDFTNVELQWQNTSRNDFEKVKIYRKNNDAPPLRRVMNFFSAGDGYTPLFETNGTSFKDLTVAANTEYTYKVTTVGRGEESPGVTTTITTPKASVIGSDVAPPVDESAPYTITWQQPTTGKILIKVGGRDYRMVDAADLSATIPKEDMRFTFLGRPDVELVPIDDNGEAGIPTIVGSNDGAGTVGSLPESLSTSNLIQTTISLLKVVAPFAIFFVVFLLAVRLIGVVYRALVPQKKVETAKVSKKTGAAAKNGTSKRTSTSKKTSAAKTNRTSTARKTATIKKPVKTVDAERVATRTRNRQAARPAAVKAVGAVDKPVEFKRKPRTRVVDRPLRRG